MRIDFQRVIVHENHISHKINTCSVKIQTCWLTGVPNLECSQTYSLTQKYCSLKLSSINIIPPDMVFCKWWTIPMGPVLRLSSRINLSCDGVFVWPTLKLKKTKNKNQLHMVFCKWWTIHIGPILMLSSVTNLVMWWALNMTNFEMKTNL